MRKRVRLVLVVLTVAALSAAVVFGQDMFAGVWRENIAKSTYSPGPPPRGPQFTKIEPVEFGLRVVEDGVSATGQKTHGEFIVKFDGRDYAFNSTLNGKPNPNADEVVSARRIDESALELTFKNRGAVVARQKIVISRDARSQIVTQTVTNAQGRPIISTIIRGEGITGRRTHAGRSVAGARRMAEQVARSIPASARIGATSSKETFRIAGRR